ncbi:transcriptional regulator CynR [Enterobacteriaceae bacterium C34A]
MILRYIHYFLAVAERGSFTRAAAALYISQPALSQQIRLLEQTLGVALFDRTGRSIRLTDAGLVFQQHARQALNALEAGARAVHDVEDLSRGHLRLGVTPTYTPWLVGPLLAAFRQRYPAIALTLSEATQEQIEQQLLNDELDIGLGFAGDHAAELTATPVLRESLVVMVSKTHELAQYQQIPLSDLAEQPLVLLDKSFATRVDIDSQCRRQGLRLNIAMETNTLGAITEMISRTPLATILPDTLAHSRNDLCAMSLSPPLSERTGVLLALRNSHHAAAAALSPLLGEILEKMGIGPVGTLNAQALP